MFSRQMSAGDLVALCRALRHYLGAGLTLVKALRHQAEQGPRGVRPLAARLLAIIEKGGSLSSALARETEVLPPLFLAMAQLGEETGHLPEVMGELEQYYRLQVALRRQFRSQSLLPVVQFVFAVLLIAGLIVILGMLAPPGKPPMLTFFGLGGGPGALAFLSAVVGTVAGIVLLWKALSRLSHQRAFADHVLLRVPALGPCLEALVLGRFTLALQLTLDSGLAIAEGLRLSLRATGNAAYAEASDGVGRVLKAGQTLTEALTQSGLFSGEFLAIVATAEEVGSVPEVMRQQAHYYHEESARRMTTLAKVASMGLWAIYAGFMVWMIFKIANVYLSALGI
jgi:type II secretory pathway component PulF